MKGWLLFAFVRVDVYAVDGKPIDGVKATSCQGVLEWRETVIVELIDIHTEGKEHIRYFDLLLI